MANRHTYTGVIVIISAIAELNKNEEIRGMKLSIDVIRAATDILTYMSM